MTSRERIVKTLCGEPADRVPFSPFLAYWWEAQSDALIHKGELEFLESIGADPLFRGHAPMYGKDGRDLLVCRQFLDDCEISSKTEGTTRTIAYRTSRGTLTLGYRYVAEGDTWFLVDHPVKTEEDFRLLQYIMENTHLEPDYAPFEQAAEALGERGLLLPLICPETKSSFQSMLEKWVGTETMVYSLMDFPETVEETLHAMQRVSMDAAKIAAASPSPFFLSWEDTSTTNISPNYYREYILPEINGWCDILHASGKRYIQHACGWLNDLLPDIAGSKIDVLESVSPAPTGNVQMQRVHEILPPRISVIGGIEPVELLEFPKDQVVGRAQELLQCMKGRGYVLANSDSCPPGVTVEKFRALADLVKNS